MTRPELVSKLRQLAKALRSLDGEPETVDNECSEAADRIEALEAEVAACHAMFDDAITVMGYDPVGPHPGLIGGVEKLVEERDAWRKAAATMNEFIEEPKDLVEEVGHWRKLFHGQAPTDYLMMVIADVHKQHADDLCWLDIDRIFAAAGLPVPDRSVGDKTAMLKNCERFITNMCQGGKWKSYAELESENVALRDGLSGLVKGCGVMVETIIRCFIQQTEDADDRESAQRVLDRLTPAIKKSRTILGLDLPEGK